MITDPSIKSAYDNQVAVANRQNSRAIAIYESDHHAWLNSLPIYAACIPPVTPPQEPRKPLLRSVDEAAFERIYLAFNAAKEDPNFVGEVDINPAFNFTVYQPAPVVTAGPLPQPRNPVGVLLDADEDSHAPAAGDVLPAGSLHTIRSTGTTYQKFRIRGGLFGIPTFVWLPLGG